MASVDHDRHFRCFESWLLHFRIKRKNLKNATTNKNKQTMPSLTDLKYPILPKYSDALVFFAHSHSLWVPILQTLHNLSLNQTAENGNCKHQIFHKILMCTSILNKIFCSLLLKQRNHRPCTCTHHGLVGLHTQNLFENCHTPQTGWGLAMMVLRMKMNDINSHIHIPVIL